MDATAEDVERSRLMAKRKIKYRYGMRMRGYSIGCQPMNGLRDVTDDPDGRYYDILAYDRMLTERELQNYELTYLGKTEGR